MKYPDFFKKIERLIKLKTFIMMGDKDFKNKKQIGFIDEILSSVNESKPHKEFMAEAEKIRKAEKMKRLELAATDSDGCTLFTDKGAVKVKPDKNKELEEFLEQQDKKIEKIQKDFLARNKNKDVTDFEPYLVSKKLFPDLPDFFYDELEGILFKKEKALVPANGTDS
jgi:hypothetical protein